MADNNDTLLAAVLATVGRQTFPVDKLAAIVLAGTSREKQLKAFNMCDGTMSQGDIAKTAKIDGGNFSRTVGRWVDEGVVFRLGTGKDAKLQHVYPLPKDATRKKAKKDE